MKLTVDRLREVLIYDQHAGVFKWSLKTNRKVVVGANAGSVTRHGYVAIRIDGTRFAAHRLAFLYVTGKWPDGEIDHINGVRSDNRWINLRACSSAENRQNQRAAHAGSSSGLLGVSWNSRLQKWVAQIAVDGRRRHLGCFDDASKARNAYVAAKRQIHPFGVL